MIFVSETDAYFLYIIFYVAQFLLVHIVVKFGDWKHHRTLILCTHLTNLFLCFQCFEIFYASKTDEHFNKQHVKNIFF